MTSALEGGDGGSGRVDKSTDKLRDHVCDKGGGGPKTRNFHGRHWWKPLYPSSPYSSLSRLLTRTRPPRPSTDSTPPALTRCDSCVVPLSTPPSSSLPQNRRPRCFCPTGSSPRSSSIRKVVRKVDFRVVCPCNIFQCKHYSC